MLVGRATGEPVRARADHGTWLLGYAAIVGGGLVVAMLQRRHLSTPWLGFTLVLLLLLLLGWVLRPRLSLYATLFLAAISDLVTVSWFPFVKNLSARESITYVNDALTISPLDITLAAGAVLSCLRHYSRTGTVLPRTAMTWPIVTFTAFVVFGFVRGVGLRGGDLRIAVLEGRALFYILMLFVIAACECTEASHFRHGFYAIVSGVTVQSLLSIVYLDGLDPADRDDLESLNEHGSSLGHNLLLVMLLALAVARVRRPILRWALIGGLVPTMFVYFLAQRRAGVAALIVAGIVVAVALLWRRRRAFWAVVPIFTIVMAGYVGAFWNSTSAIAFPAQAVKTIVSPESASAEDQSSDLYRLVESYNLNFTIRASPTLGLGFGHAFYRPVSLPDISFFELNEYLPHNSVLWIWIKTGFGGFAAMFYMLVKAMLIAGDRVRRRSAGLDLVVTLSATAFVVMYAIYSYVDVSWDARNSVFLAFSFAALAFGVPTRRGVPATTVAAATEPSAELAAAGGADRRQLEAAGR
jgi:hypothetical protein